MYLTLSFPPFNNQTFTSGKEKTESKEVTAEFWCNAAPNAVTDCTASLFSEKIDVPYKMTWVMKGMGMFEHAVQFEPVTRLWQHDCTVNLTKKWKKKNVRPYKSVDGSEICS